MFTIELISLVSITFVIISAMFVFHKPYCHLIGQMTLFVHGICPWSKNYVMFPCKDGKPVDVNVYKYIYHLGSVYYPWYVGAIFACFPAVYVLCVTY